MKRIAMAADHAGYEMKEMLKTYLIEKGYEVEDFGTNSTDSCDYPDFAHPAADAVEKGECALGICMCGSGNGINMTLNHHAGIRSALCWLPEIASLARQHNNANICVLPARFISESEGRAIVDAYLEANYEGGRHDRRINKIPVGIIA